MPKYDNNQFIEAIARLGEWMEENSIRRGKVRITIEFESDIDRDHAVYKLRTSNKPIVQPIMITRIHDIRPIDKNIPPEEVHVTTFPAFHVLGIPVRLKSPQDTPKDLDEFLRDVYRRKP